MFQLSEPYDTPWFIWRSSSICMHFILNVKGKPNAFHLNLLPDRYTREASQPLRQLGRRQHHHTVAKRRRRHAVCGGAERSSLIGCQPGGRHCDEEQGGEVDLFTIDVYTRLITKLLTSMISFETSWICINPVSSCIRPPDLVGKYQSLTVQTGCNGNIQHCRKCPPSSGLIHRLSSETQTQLVQQSYHWPLSLHPSLSWTGPPQRRTWTNAPWRARKRQVNPGSYNPPI